MKHFRVLLASPGDVDEERKAMQGVVDALNDKEGKKADYRLELIRYETHSAPSAGRAQAVINEDIGPYDIFLGMMWKRLGTPSGVADSGTVEEFDNAYAAWKKDNTRPVLFYFCQRPFMPKSVDEAEQALKVLQFRHRIESKRQALAWNYERAEAFPELIRKHLHVRTKALCKARSGGKKPDAEEVEDLRGLWDRMAPEVQRAFQVAYNENRLRGDGGIKTKDLFAALLRVAGDEVAPLTADIPDDALPRPTKGPLFDANYILGEMPWLSHCVATSVKRLSKDLKEGETLSAIDIFADIAHKGTGDSVQQLRDHKIGPDEIEAILAKNGLELVSKGEGSLTG